MGEVKVTLLVPGQSFRVKARKLLSDLLSDAELVSGQKTRSAPRCMTAFRCKPHLSCTASKVVIEGDSTQPYRPCLSTSDEAKHFSLRQLRRSPSRCLAMASCLVSGCGTPLTQPARVKTACIQLKLPRTVSGLQRGAALAGRKSGSGHKRSRHEPLFVSCAASPGALSPEDQAINEQIDKAARMLNSMMEEIHQEAFVSGAVSEVTGQAPEVTEAEAIRKAVANRLDQLDEAFLMALGAYISAAEEQGDKALAGRLSRIQQQVLQAVSKRLPPEMQILDIVLRLLSRNERMSILRQAASGQGGDNVPPCNIKRVRGAALQLVSDMEEKDAIPDRRLLARLCIAREEIAEVVAEQQYANRSGSTEDMYEHNMALHNQSVPKASIAFLKELMTMSDEAKRKAFLQKAFREEFEPGKQSRKADSQHASSSSVRPGSFLTCVTATQVQMQGMKGAESTLAKLETIRREALQALESIAA